ncbi:hypothetical protein JCM8547_004119 [Rhodosporidiobolus lusitaniae]
MASSSASRALLRRSLAPPLTSSIPSLSPGPSTPAFSLACKKLVLQYSELAGSNKGARSFIGSGMVVDLARRFPGVEVVVERREGKHPVLRGVYSNGRTKEICVRSLEPSSILKKAQLLLDASGAKIQPIRRPGVQSATESVRGVWSAFHEEERR